MQTPFYVNIYLTPGGGRTFAGGHWKTRTQAVRSARVMNEKLNSRVRVTGWKERP